MDQQKESTPKIKTLILKTKPTKSSLKQKMWVWGIVVTTLCGLLTLYFVFGIGPRSGTGQQVITETATILKLDKPVDCKKIPFKINIGDYNPLSAASPFITKESLHCYYAATGLDANKAFTLTQTLRQHGYSDAYGLDDDGVCRKSTCKNRLGFDRSTFVTDFNESKERGYRVTFKKTAPAKEANQTLELVMYSTLKIRMASYDKDIYTTPQPINILISYFD